MACTQIATVVTSLIVLFATSCKYIENRLSDALDIVTINGETDLGFTPSLTVTAGPFRGIGLASRIGYGEMGYNAWGLTGGRVGANAYLCASAFLIGNKEIVIVPGERNKSYALTSIPLLPVIEYGGSSLPDIYAERFNVSETAPAWIRYGDFNIYAGWFAGVRVGFNICEVLDLALGVAGFDPAEDDQ